MKPRIGRNDFLIAYLLDDAIVVREGSPESSFHQKLVQINQRLQAYPRRADRQLRTNDRIEHPCRHDNRRARLSFYEDNLPPEALLPIKAVRRHGNLTPLTP